LLEAEESLCFDVYALDGVEDLRSGCCLSPSAVSTVFTYSATSSSFFDLLLICLTPIFIRSRSNSFCVIL